MEARCERSASPGPTSLNPNLTATHRTAVCLVSDQDVELVKSDGGWMLDNQRSGRETVVNNAAACIWQLCQQGMDTRQITQALAAHFPTARGLFTDVQQALDHFENLGLARRAPSDQKYHGVSYTADYQPVPGTYSKKAERLVEYCLGTYIDRPIPACSSDLHYTAAQGLRSPSLLLEHLPGELNLWRKEPADVEFELMDQKRIVEALLSQRAFIPPSLCCWVVRGDGAGLWTDPAQGPHLAAVREKQYDHVILVPGFNRERYLGPRLARQMEALRQSWTAWDSKLDAAWWGGAATGGPVDDPDILSRYRFLNHYCESPSKKVRIHVTDYPSWRENTNPAPKGPFEKCQAFRHKCVILLKGNDVPSGLSWFFCGNSVVLMQPPELEHIQYFDMEPWIHYVPLEPDPADVLIKLRWVLDHQDEALKIVHRAHEHLCWLTGSEYLWACNEVLRRVAEDSSWQESVNQR